MTYDPKKAGADCDNCPLKGRTVVPPEGKKSATFAIVGEAPGFNEELQRRPFVGASGGMVMSLLEANDLKRKDVWISNALLCRPPDVSQARPGNDSALDPKQLKLAMECCRPRLIKELRALKRLKTVSALGASSLRSITGKAKGIQKARGFIWEIDLNAIDTKKAVKKADKKVAKKAAKKAAKAAKKAERVKKLVSKPINVVPSVHPAFVLRAPAWEPIIATDINRAVRIDREGYRPISVETYLAPPYEQICALLERLGPVISLDVETTKATATTCKLLCIGVSDGNLAIVIPYATAAHPLSPYYGRHRQAIVMRCLREALKTRTVVTHNGPGFDHIVMARYGIDISRDAKAWDDTLLAHHTIASHLPQRLDHLVSMALDAPPWKIISRKPAMSDGAEKGAWDPEKLQDQELWHYNSEDVVFTIRTWFSMQEDLAEESSVYFGDKRLSLLCRNMQEAGFAVDEDRRRALRWELQGRQNRYVGMLRQACGFRIKPTKLVDVRHALFDVLHAPVLFRSGLSNAPSTSVDTLQALAQKEGAPGNFARLLLKWREAWKLRSTYVDGIAPERDGRVHPAWRAWGTVSGRLSCRAPNLQNLKRGNSIRSMYVAGPGKTLVAFDFSQLEMRIAAYLSGDEVFIKACEEGDLHANNAYVLFGELPKEKEKLKPLRDVAKQAGFAVAYMAQAQTVHARLVAQGFNLSLAQVEVMLNRMRRSYRRYYEWQEENLLEVARLGYARTYLSGRKRWFGHTPSPTEAANSPIQSGASDLANSKLPEIEDALPKGARIIAQVHDAGYIECDRRLADRVAKLCKEIAESPIEINGRKARFPVDVKQGERWSDV